MSRPPARVLPCFVTLALVDLSESVRAETAADFCLERYRRLSLLEGIEVVRSGDPEVRRLLLHRGGDQYLELPDVATGKESISPSRDTRLRWMH